MSHFIAVHVDRYLRRLFPNVAVTTAPRPEMWATQICIQVQTHGGEWLVDKGHFISQEAQRYPAEFEHLAYELAFDIARDIMMHKPTRKEIR